jgi:hypothetical protein
MGIWQAWLNGYRLALRFWKVIAILYLVSLGLSLVLVSWSALQLIELSRRLAIKDVADGLDSWLLLEMIFTAVKISPGDEQFGLVTSSGRTFLLNFTLLFVGILFFSSFTSAFLGGGLINTYKMQPTIFRLRQFWQSCWHWFLSFFLLSIWQLFLFCIAGLIFLVLFSLLDFLPEYFSSIFIWSIGCAFLFFWFISGELTRVYCIIDNQRNFISPYLKSVKMIISNPALVFGFFAISIIFLFGINLIGRFLILANLPLEHFWITIPVQQLFIFLRILIVSSRYAGIFYVIKPPQEEKNQEALVNSALPG